MTPDCDLDHLDNIGNMARPKAQFGCVHLVNCSSRPTFRLPHIR
ncbi:MAG TPA: hypothetical protein PLB02_00200 [Thermoanaerobaculia bacterium]|nr:hypothetical protein [Thermoanaerobaculia bacterium]